MNANYSTNSLIALSTLFLLGVFEASAPAQEDRAGREGYDRAGRESMSSSSYRAESTYREEPSPVARSKKKKSATGQSSGSASSSVAPVVPVNDGKAQNKADSSAHKKESPQPSQSPRANNTTQTSPMESPYERAGQKKPETEELSGHATKKEETKPSPSGSPQ